MIRDKNTIYAEKNDPSTIIAPGNLMDMSFIKGFNALIGIDHPLYNIVANTGFSAANQYGGPASGILFRKNVINKTINAGYKDITYLSSLGGIIGIYLVIRNKVFDIRRIFTTTNIYDLYLKEGQDLYRLNIIYDKTISSQQYLSIQLWKNGSTISSIDGSIYFEYCCQNI